MSLAAATHAQHACAHASSSTSPDAHPSPNTKTPRTRRRHDTSRSLSLQNCVPRQSPPPHNAQGEGEHPGVRCMIPGLPLLPIPPAAPQGFRFWLDEVLWSQGRVAVELIDEVLRDAGGVRTGGPPRAVVRGPIDRVLGSEHCDRWDVLWSKSTFALRAARSLRPGQQISAIVGLNTLTMKKRMLQTLKAAFGQEGAWQITPVSFTLPEELHEWKQWVAALRGGRSGAANHPQAGGDTHGDGDKQGSRGAKIRGHTEKQQQLQQPQQQQHHNEQQPLQGKEQQQEQCWHGATGDLDHELWILKTGQDAGKGLQLLPLRKALQVAEHSWEQGTTKRKHQLQVAQLYLTKPLLLGGRKSHLRLWVVVTHHNPLKAFLHRRGLVLFSSELYDSVQPFAGPIQNTATSDHSGSSSSSSSGSNCSSDSSNSSSGSGSNRGMAVGHLTNLARNTAGLVWGMDQLEDALGCHAFAFLWAQLQQRTAAALRATQGALLEAHEWLRPSLPAYGFQLLGFDYMLDHELRPWLIEVNSAPSIMAEHEDLATASSIRDHKQAMLRDLWALVRHRVWRSDEGKQGRAGKQHSAACDRGEHAAGSVQGGFVRLLP